MIRACYECLSKDEKWLRSYWRGWLAVTAFGLAAFLLPLGEFGVYPQAVFFVILFIQVFRPIYASRHIWNPSSQSDCK